MDRTKIVQLLDKLLVFEDILACMVVKKGLDGIVPSKVRIKNIDLWRLVHQTTDDVFDLIDKFYSYGVGRINLELGEYNIIIAPISRTVSLLVLTPSLANVGLLDVEIENTKLQILGLAEAA